VKFQPYLQKAEVLVKQAVQQLRDEMAALNELADELHSGSTRIAQKAESQHKHLLQSSKSAMGQLREAESLIHSLSAQLKSASGDFVALQQAIENEFAADVRAQEKRILKEALQ